MRRTWVVSMLSALALAGLACGDDGDDGRAGARPPLTVAAATPFKAAFTAYGSAFREGRATFEFADSDALGARIRKGDAPDVFAAASTELPEALHAEGRVNGPVVFASDELVLAKRYGNGEGLDLDDVARRGARLAIGAKSLHVGRFTRAVLDRLPRSRREAILANVRSEEPDVAGMLEGVASGAVDAAFVYRSQLRVGNSKLVEARLPAELRPFVEYGAVIVGGARQPAVAKAFIYGLLADAGNDALQRASFGPPLYGLASKRVP